jgi:predicted nuclease of predicted toxin-antitoxin system
MRFFMDEDVTVNVGRLLAGVHSVEYARDVFGPETKDPALVAYAREHGQILVTADGAMARKLRQNRRSACLYLRDLYTAELDRVRELLPVLESEALIAGQRFYMQISQELFLVGR